MTTWARHPWYNPPSLKRKLSASDDDDDPSYSATLPSSADRKRIRYNSLERTLADMTLATAEDVDMWPKISPPRPRAQESTHVMFPSSVEEPELVEMDVEPTVVTTDTFASDAGQLDIREVQISSAALECIKRQACSRPLIPLPRQTTQPSRALVLYRTPRPPSPESARASVLVAQEDDVMEVE